MKIDDIKNEILESTKSAFDRARNYYGKDEICGYALYSDDGAMSVCNVVNTYSSLDKKELEEKEYYKWSFNEWENYAGEDELQNISKLVCHYSSSAESDNKINEFRRSLYEACIQVLEALVAEGYFGTEDEREKLFLIFAVTDTSDEEIELNSARRLNASQVYEKYNKWYESEIA